MKKRNKKISYEREADILRVELSSAAIDYAEELGPFVVHYSKRRMPVYVELLNASQFLKESERAFVREGLLFGKRAVPATYRSA